MCEVATTAKPFHIVEISESSTLVIRTTSDFTKNGKCKLRNVGYYTIISLFHTPMVRFSLAPVLYASATYSREMQMYEGYVTEYPVRTLGGWHIWIRLDSGMLLDFKMKGIKGHIRIGDRLQVICQSESLGEALWAREVYNLTTGKRC